MSRRALAHSRPSIDVRQPEPPEKPIPVEVLAQAIIDISAAMKKIDASRLRREAVVLLISEHSGVGKPAVRLVLNNLEALESIWLKPKSKNLIDSWEASR